MIPVADVTGCHFCVSVFVGFLHLFGTRELLCHHFFFLSFFTLPPRRRFCQSQHVLNTVTSSHPRCLFLKLVLLSIGRAFQFVCNLMLVIVVQAAKQELSNNIPQQNAYVGIQQ